MDTWRAAVLLCVFLLVILAVVLTPSVQIGRRRVLLDLAVAPPLGLLLCLLATALRPMDVADGLLGRGTLVPYAIIILFFSLSFVCVALDVTGALAFVALQFAQRSGSSGKKLFFAFFALSSILTIFTSNDIVILTVTPILLHFTDAIRVDPTPFLFAQFFAANVWSSLLYIGNPTNIIAAQAYQLTFFGYMVVAALPTLVAGILLAVLLLLYFRTEIPAVIAVPRVDPYSVVKDRSGAVFGTVVLFSALIALTVFSFTTVPVWAVTLPFGLLSFARCLYYDWKVAGRRSADIGLRAQSGAGAGDAAAAHVSEMLHNDSGPTSEEAGTASPRGREAETVELRSLAGGPLHSGAASDAGGRMDGGGEVIPAAAAAASEAAAVDGGPGPSRGGAESGADGSGAAITARASQFASRFPTTTLVLQRQPWKIIPFVASMFAFVEGFSSVGLIREISAAFAVSSNDLASVVFLFGFLSSLACNVLNNQPMTILFVTVIQSPFFDVSEAHRKAALFATVLGSNYGANLTPIGALAGVMWTQILRGYGHEISFSHFARVGFTVTPPVIAAACLALYLVLRAGA